MTGFLGPSGRVNNSAPPPTGLRVSSSIAGKPRAIAYGKIRIAYTLLWAANFQHRGGDSGGKGGGGKGGGGQFYTVDAIQGICEGPISAVTRIWNESGDQTAPPGDNLIPYRTIYLGTYTQNPDALVESDLGGSQALSYRGTAYAIGPNMNIGDSPNLGNDTFEVLGAINTTVSAYPDACPSLIVRDYLTNPYYSLGFPAGLIDPSITDATNVQSMASYCRAAGLLVSTAITDARAANDWLKSLLKAVNCEARWSGGLLTIVPYGDAALSANGSTYTPVTSPLYSLGDDDFVAKPGEAPIKATIKDQSQTINDIRVEYLDRGNSYNPEIAEAWDDALIQAFGRRSSDAGGDHFFALASAAQMSAQLQLGREQIVTTYEFALGARHILLDVLDIVALNDAALGLSDLTVRITEIEEQEDGTLKFTAEDYLVGTGNAPVYGIIPKAGTQPSFNIAAPPINTPIIFEPQSSLTGGVAQVWIGLSGVYGSVQPYISVGGDSYYPFGDPVTAQCRMGVLTGSLTAFSGANPDTTNTLGVNLTESDGTLNSGSSADAAAARTLCWVDGELIAYETATLTSANEYNLTTLYRGLYGTTAASHASGAQFLRLDDNVVKYTLPANYIGQTLSFKFPATNVYGGGIQDLSTCTVYTYGANGEGYQTPAPAGAISVQVPVPSVPSGLTASGGNNCVVLTWNPNPEASIQGYKVWATFSHDGSFGDAAIVAIVDALTWTHNNIGYGTLMTYWLEAYTAAGASSPEGPVYAQSSFITPAVSILTDAISDNLLIPILQQSIANIEAVAQGAVVAAAQSTTGLAQIAVERTVRASADQVLASQITTVEATLNGSIAAVQENITTVASNLSTTASDLTTVTTTVDGQSASIAANTESINGALARYTVQIELDTDGNKYVGGFGLIGSEDGSGGVAFNATFLVTSFTIAQLNDSGVMSSIAPFEVIDGNVVIDNAIIQNLSATVLGSGNITTANIVVSPAGSGAGLTVYQYNEAGNVKIMDTANGLYPNSATLIPTVTYSSAGFTPSWTTIADLGSQSYIGRFANVAIVFDIASYVYDFLLEQSASLRLLIDSAVVSEWDNLTAGENHVLSVSLPGYLMGAGSHDISIQALSNAGDGGTMHATGCLTVCDFKA